MSYGKQYDRALDLANGHARDAKHHAERFQALHQEAKTKKKRHRDRVLAANHFWRWRWSSACAKEFALEAQAIKDEADKQQSLLDEISENMDAEEVAEMLEEERVWSLEEIQTEYKSCTKAGRGTAHIPSADTDALKAADTRKATVETYRGEQYDMIPSFCRFGFPGWTSQQLNEHGGGLIIPCDSIEEARKKMRWHIDQGIVVEPEPTLFEIRKTAPALIGAQTTMLQTLDDPQQLRLFA